MSAEKTVKFRDRALTHRLLCGVRITCQFQIESQRLTVWSESGAQPRIGMTEKLQSLSLTVYNKTGKGAEYLGKRGQFTW